MSCISTYSPLTSTVARVSMESTDISVTESSVDASVCAVLLQSQRLEVTLSVFVDTIAGTATGRV